MNQTSRDNFAAGPDDDDSPVGIIALWQLLWRNKQRILIPAFGLAFLTGLLVLRSDDTYTAEAQILLTRGNLEIVEFDSAGDIEVSPGAITNALTILGSRSIALGVIDRVDLTNDPEINPNLLLPDDADPEEFYPENVVRQLALDWLAAYAQANILPGSNAILIRVTTTGPGKSAAIANAYVDEYLEYQVRSGQNETKRAAVALETRVNELRLQLEEDQQRLQSFRGGAVSSVLDSSDALMGEAVDIRARLASTENALIVTDAAIAALTAVDDAGSETLSELIAQNEILSRLQRSTLGRSINTDSFDQDIQAIESALQDERARLVRLRDALTDGRTAIEARIAEVNAFTVGLRQLEVEVETTSQVYESSLARLKELSIQTGLRDAGAQVLARAEAPLRTDAQGRRRMVAIAGFLGLFFGIAYVLLREAANDRVRKVSELVDITGSDCVVQLPPAHPGVLGRGMLAGFGQSKRKAAPFKEGMRSLRHKLIARAGRTSGPLIAGIFSSLPTEGKSTVTQGLASSFTMIDRRVIVVDGDMRAGTLSKTLGVAPDQPGLQNVIVEKFDLSKAIVSLSEQGFDLLPSGQSDMNPADLLESDRFGELIMTLRERYDVVLFDTPPVLVLPDAVKIAVHLNAHVLVADYDRSPRAAVRDTVAALQEVDVEHLVVAFCNAPKAFGQKYGFSDQAYAEYWN
ncbi:hypothetical protein ROLI_044430 [Roseobacter fucihabitans]|uniref:non-specific protein-tyrosine kinase n=1 Tax=Roseobacter fucihabitans TaxID=1537242 RepID=A0ABZ2C231_9RHOB|nr:polysaccharide biosynthesis tyrosine autokinase [Roseobacter litoralis]MBC6963922.1 Tyrosine-protein kinase wzc [Roseobacter litoralis]MBC6963993.1 Tyrosine-protein kinase wzc [Roseobacter litoralis]